jgi:phosphoketolase
MEIPMPDTLSPDLAEKMHAYWRSANYLSVGQVYLKDNPLLEVPLTLAHIKPRLLGHWGTTPGLNFLYVHLSGSTSRRPRATAPLAPASGSGRAMTAAIPTWSWPAPATSRLWRRLPR